MTFATKLLRSAAACALLAGIAAPGMAAAQTRPQVAPALSKPVSVRRAEVLATAEKLADWQLRNIATGELYTRYSSQTLDPRQWQQGAMWIGYQALAARSRSPRFRDAILAVGRKNEWRLGEREYMADDHVIGQSYLWAAKNGVGAAAIAPLRARFDAILAKPAVAHLSYYVDPSRKEEVDCTVRWCWADALFMAPPAWVELSRQTSDRRYRDFALREYWKTVDFLYDPQEHLFYRDSRYFHMRDDAKHKLFWSRGNGWVFAGLALTIPLLEAGDPDRKRLEALYVEMAEKLRRVQKADGYWAPSLLARDGSPPETSGTGFFTYGLAWGIRQGLIDRAQYEPTVRSGWSALVRAIQPDGRLGYVQQVSDKPELVAAADTQVYGTGAFLLAASAVADLDLK